MQSVGRILLLALIFGFVSSPVLAASSQDKVIPDVVYGHKHGMALPFDVFEPAEPNGAGVLFMVSGGWRSRWIEPEKMAQRFSGLLDKGFTVFAVRHGSSPKYVIPEIVADVRRSVRYIRAHAKEFGIDPNRLGVFGGSAGGHLSLMLGSASDQGDPDAKDKIAQHSDRVAAVVAYFPPTDLKPYVPKSDTKNTRFPALNFDPDKSADYSPIEHVSADDPPTLFVHGDKDSLVPLYHSERMHEALKGKGVPTDILVLEGAGHGFRGDDDKRAREALVGWFEKYLGENGTPKAANGKK